MKLMTFFQRYKELLIIFFLYSSANILLLLNTSGIYWDDWSLVNNSYETKYDMFSQASGTFLGTMGASLHHTLLSVGNGIFVYRVLTFIMYFFIILFLFTILNKIKELSTRDRFFIITLFSVAPLNSARIAIINFPYVLYLGIFFFAFYLLSNKLDRGRYFLRYIILALFFISFIINSLLVFYAIVLFFIFYINYMHREDRYMKKLQLFIFSNLDFILLPIIFFMVKVNYCVSTGLYASYNSINLESLFAVPVGVLIAFYTAFVEPISQSASLLPYFWGVLFIFLIYVKSNEYTSQNRDIKMDFIFLYVGIIFFILAVFPYVAVGKIPTMDALKSRHQLLVPLGFVFMLYFGIKIISVKMKFTYYVEHAIMVFFVLAFLTQNVYSYYGYKQDWFYQVAIEEQMKESALIRQNSTFVVEVALENKLANGRKLSFYEQNGRLKKIFNRDNRLMVNDEQELNRVLKYRQHKQYNFSTWIPQDIIYLRITEKKQSNFYFLKLFFYEFYNQKKFRILAKDLIKIKALKHVSE